MTILPLSQLSLSLPSPLSLSLQISSPNKRLITRPTFAARFACSGRSAPSSLPTRVETPKPVMLAKPMAMGAAGEGKVAQASITPQLPSPSMAELHFFLLPFLAPGHTIPMVDLAKLLAARPGVKATIVTTSANAESIKPAIASSPHPIALLTLPFPPSIPQNGTDLPNPGDFSTCPEFVQAIEALKHPFDRLVVSHRPDCIVSDTFFTWSADVASDHGIPRLVYQPMGAFATIIMSKIPSLDDGDDKSAEDGVMVVLGIPHRIEMAKSQLIPRFDGSSAGHELFESIGRAYVKSYGAILNSFAEMEPGYPELFSRRWWMISPVAMCNKDASESAARGSKQVGNYDACMSWLDTKKPGSVINVCFGTVAGLTGPQLREIANGLKDSDHPFIWVVGNAECLPEGIVDEGKGLVVRGWAPQTVVLSHPAIGGFLTHCGWNACLEGATAGVPMVTWPQFGEHFHNERLLVDVLRVGVSVGAKVCSCNVEARTFVKGEAVAKAVNEVMGGGVEAEGRRKRAKEMAVKARKAMEEGGSSFVDMSKMIQELMDVKKTGVDEACAQQEALVPSQIKP